ncbi:MAG: hypothetical protein ABSA93_00415 [Streptosporangiaceae bacterium]
MRMRGRLREPVVGTFRVTAVSTSIEGSRREYHARVSGVVSGPEVAATAVSTWVRGLRHLEDVPSAGQEYDALVDRKDPSRFEVHWPPRLDPTSEKVRDEAYSRQVAAAIRLGLDPSVVPPALPPPTRMRAIVRGMADERVGNGPLPDGSMPVGTTEADQLLESGEAAMATITGIDFLPIPAAVLPSPEASIANVALKIQREDGSSYQALARFGYRNEARRAQVGFVGASVPVRINPDDPSRVALDVRDLPPVD